MDDLWAFGKVSQFGFMTCFLMSQSTGAALAQLSRTPVKSRGSFQKGFVKVLMVCAHLLQVALANALFFDL